MIASSGSRSFVLRPCVLGGVALLASLALGCGSSSSPPLPQTDGGGVLPDSGPLPEGGLLPDQGGLPDAVPPVGDSGAPAALPAVPQQSGVVYVGHFYDSDLEPSALAIYRTDGLTPRLERTFTLGLQRVVHDMALDPYADLLYVVHDLQREVDIYRLSRPAAANQPVADPVKLATVAVNTSADGENTPRFVLVNPQRKRLYVFASPPPVSGSTTKDHLLYVYDVTNPSAPALLAGSPHTIPVTVSMAIDPAREVLFLVELTSNLLHGIDLAGDGFAPMPGAPLDLPKLYPQQQPGSGLQVRQLRADPWRNRLYAGRQQAALSELMVIEYPAALPAAGQKYGDLAALGDFKPLQGPFDVNVPHTERPNLIGAYMPVVDLARGDVFMSALAHTGTTAAAIMLSASVDLALGNGCAAFEGFGCWYRSYLDGKADSYLQTDGAACVDYTHRIAVGTSLSPLGEGNPGMIHLFKINPDLSMQVWLPEGGGNLKAGMTPIAAICH